MRLAHFTLIGFSLSLICANICPMTMDAMPMEHDMQMMAQGMHHDGGAKDTGCERCEQNGEELTVASTLAVAGPSGNLQIALDHAVEPAFSTGGSPVGKFLSSAGPPSSGPSLVGTVVLRT